MCAAMPLAPKGGLKPQQPPSRKGKFKTDADSNRTARRCECCGVEGQDVPTPPKGSTTPVQYGLNVMGIMTCNIEKARKGDVRFGDHAVNERISWITRPVDKKRGLSVAWPDGTGPLCYVCADKIRTLQNGDQLEWRYVESARAEYCAQNDGTTLPFPWSCVAEDGSIVPASDPRAKHGPMALPCSGRA